MLINKFVKIFFEVKSMFRNLFYGWLLLICSCCVMYANAYQCPQNTGQYIVCSADNDAGKNYYGWQYYFDKIQECVAH